MKTALSLVPALGLSLLLTACAGTSPRRAPASPEQAVTQRAGERWQHIIAGDLKAAYAYLSPGARKVMPYENYAQRMGQSQVRWTGARVKQVNCEDAQSCRAEMELDIVVMVPGITGGSQVPIKSSLSENWLESGGQWYFLPSEAH